MGFLDETKRRPAPGPAKIDVRVPVAVGTLVWLLAGIAALVWFEPLEAAGRGWWATAAFVGVALGVVGLIVLQLRRRRGRDGAGAGD